MLSTHGRTAASALLKPVALALLRLRLGPDAVSVTGTIGVVVAALALIPFGHLTAAALAIAALALFDTVDGLMARELEARGVRRSKDFGAFLDSTLDRVADGAIFGGLVVWFASRGAVLDLWLALACLVFGSVVPYARARAEGLGMTASGGIAERADRLAVVLIVMFITGLGGPDWLMTVVLALLAVASAITVGQRVATVRRQAMERLNAGPSTEPAAGGVAPGTIAAQQFSGDESAETVRAGGPVHDSIAFDYLRRATMRPAGLLARRWVRMSAPRPRRNVEPWLTRRAERRRAARPRRGR